MSDSAAMHSPTSVPAEPSRWARGLDSLTWQRVLLLSLLGAALVAAYVYFLVPRRYAATASILLPDQPDILTSLNMVSASTDSSNGGGGGAAGGATGALGALGLVGGSDLQRLEAALSSRRIRDQILDRFQLRQRMQLRTEAAALKWMDQATTYKDLGAGAVPGMGGGVGVAITVTFPSTKRVLEWTGRPWPFSTADAEKISAEVANSYVSYLDQYIKQTNVKNAHDDRLFLESQKKQAEDDLNKTENQLLALQAKSKVIDPTLEVQQLLTIGQSATQAYAQAYADLVTAQSSLPRARQALGAQQAMRIAAEVKERNPVLANLENNIAQMRLDLATGLATGKAPQHPDMVALRSGIASAESQEADLTREIRTAITTDTNPIHDALVGQVVTLEVAQAGAQARKDKFGAFMAELDAQVNHLPPIARQFVHLSRQRDLQADLLATLAKRLEFALLQEQMQSTGRFQILDTALPPDDKAGPSAGLSFIASFLLFATLLGVASAYRRGLLSVEQ